MRYLMDKLDTFGFTVKRHLGLLLLIWINFNPSMDNYYIHHKVGHEMSYSVPNFNGCTVEVRQCISNFTHTLLGM